MRNITVLYGGGGGGGVKPSIIFCLDMQSDVFTAATGNSRLFRRPFTNYSTLKPVQILYYQFIIHLFYNQLFRWCGMNFTVKDKKNLLSHNKQ